MNERSSTVRMTEGNTRLIILRFAAPLFLSQLFQQLYNTADSLIVGRFLGTEALGAVSSSGSLINLMTGFVIGITTGAGVIISKYYGAGDDDNVRLCIHTAIPATMILGLAATLLGVFFSPMLLRVMGTDASVMPYSVQYFRIYFTGGIAVTMYNMCRSIMTSLGDSRRPLIYLGISSVLNIVLDWLFVAVFGWGVWSAAFATVLSQVCSVVMSLLHLCNRSFPFRIRASRLCLNGPILYNMLRVGVPTGVQNSVINLANVLVQSNINSFGANAMAACGTYFKIEGFVFLPIYAFSMANTTFVGQNLGAGKYERAREGARFGILFSTVFAEIIGIILVLSGEKIMRLFTSDPAVIAIGVRQFHTEAPFHFLLSFDHCVAGVCRGAGKATVPMIIMLGIWCVLRIGYITAAMAVKHEIVLLFWAYPLTWGISAVFFLVYFLRSNWVHGLEKV